MRLLRRVDSDEQGERRALSKCCPRLGVGRWALFLCSILLLWHHFAVVGFDIPVHMFLSIDIRMSMRMTGYCVVGIKYSQWFSVLEVILMRFVVNYQTQLCTYRFERGKSCFSFDQYLSLRSSSRTASRW